MINTQSPILDILLAYEQALAECGKTLYLQVCSQGLASKAAVTLGIRHLLLPHEQAREERLAKL